MARTGRGGRRIGAGRKPKPVALHIAAGTFRPSRHAKLLETTATDHAMTAGAEVAAGLGIAGRALVLAHLLEFTDWDARSLHYLRQAGEARDRQVQVAAVIDVDTTAPGLGRSVALLRAERAAGAAVLAALRALEVKPASAKTPAKDGDAEFFSGRRGA